jgi:hypothetical protein
MGFNYYNTLHLDERDPHLSFIGWWLEGDGHLTGGGFRLGNTYLQFTPLQGTVRALPENPGVIPYYSRKSVEPSKWSGMDAKAKESVFSKLSDEDASKCLADTECWGWMPCE